MTTYESRREQEEAQLIATFAESVLKWKFLDFLTEPAAERVCEQLAEIFDENDAVGNAHEFVIDFRVPLEDGEGSTVTDSVLTDFHFHMLRYEDEQDDEEADLTVRCFGQYIESAGQEHQRGPAVARLFEMKERGEREAIGGLSWVVIDGSTDVDWDQVAQIPFHQTM